MRLLVAHRSLFFGAAKLRGFADFTIACASGNLEKRCPYPAPAALLLLNNINSRVFTARASEVPRELAAARNACFAC